MGYSQARKLLQLICANFAFDFSSERRPTVSDSFILKEDNLGVLNSTAWQLYLSVDVFGKRLGGDRLGDYIDEYY